MLHQAQIMFRDPSSDSIPQVAFDQAIEERYLAYALSTIMSRSLPDVRDGLKPVHRRLIYAMHQLKLDPHSAFKKSARIVGDVMGKFHPHGDSAIYGALVRLAQEFCLRYPLIEGQGNFGNIDGDSAAAMRYTEARLSRTALIMMRGLDHDCVSFTPTYDGDSEEPTLFPTLFPNLLANGANGIAVGMATSIPPHNAEELFLALEYLVDHGEATTADLMQFIQGPDFPTGGLLMEDSSTLRTCYETGHGSLRLRAHWFTEPLKNGAYAIVVDQIPYQVEKSKLVEKMAALILERKNAFIEDIQDQSTDEMRLVIYPKNRHLEPEVVMESLFAQTDLAVRFNVNMTALDDQGTPRVMSLKEMLSLFLAHCYAVLDGEAHYHLARIEARLNILRGLQVVYLNLDAVIAIIRTADDPKEELIAQFSLNIEQAEAILNMRLRSLHKIQELAIRKETKALTAERKEHEEWLHDSAKRSEKIKQQFNSLRALFASDTDLGKRRTQIIGRAKTIEIPEVQIEKEDVLLCCSSKNWVRVSKGHKADAVRYKEGDEARFIIPCTTHDKVVLLSASGRAYTLDPTKLLRGKGGGWESLRFVLDIPDGEDVIDMHCISQDAAEATYAKPLFLLLTDRGYGFRIAASNLISQTKKGRQVLALRPGEAAAAFCPIGQADSLVLIGTNRKMVALALEEIPERTSGHGVILQRYTTARLSDLQLCQANTGFSWRRQGKPHTTSLAAWQAHRGAIGHLPPTLFPRDNQFHF